MSAVEARSPAPSAPGRWAARAVVVVVLVLAALAWVATVWLHPDHAVTGTHPDPAAATAPGHGAGHGAVDAAGSWGPRALAWLGGWVLMVLAMMLPPALPFLRMLAVLVHRRARPWLVLAAGAAGFVAVWTAAGIVLALVATGLGNAAAFVPGGVPPARLTAAVALAVAGLYQLTPWKTACLRACRSPRSFAAAHWRGIRPPRVEAALMGSAYGATCVGCCWALMALAVLGGAAGLATMVLLTLVMVAERAVPRSTPFARVVGAALLVLAVAALLPATS